MHANATIVVLGHSSIYLYYGCATSCGLAHQISDLYAHMRFPQPLLLFSLLGLAACQPDLNSGPRVDFVASSRFTTGNRRLTTPGDTVATRIYAEAEKDSRLTRMLITAEYQPVPEGIIYPQVGYVEGDQPTFKLTYLDSTFETVARFTTEFAFQSVQPTRTTPGKETWVYEATDTNGNTGKRSFFLRLGRTDSLYIYHSYRVGLQAPTPDNAARRSYLALRSGLALPKFTVRTAPQNTDAQQLIDLVYVPNVTTGPGLATPANSRAKLPDNRWPIKRQTRIRRTTLNETTFTTLTTTTQLTAAFAAGTQFTDSTYTGAVTKNQVIAFRTPENKTGAILIEDIIATPTPTFILQVRVTK
ncbi:hypothetical protein HMJ29_08245 [Hymenobacter taeanensis]|uniref:DUF4249 domain-containing protein n=1 Tax=Hymenobacter taeanensis TaxID=2735321 RepID=A0A6M6BG24_9BACT|nr:MULTISPECIES: hypothetical protein [Hymenobacter]QJX46922.1 hypothetical protein HMJ29_08245 [Hymenobacter taeanensis]UOQ80797.1 hypothetical protein MUN83_18590 [Hymenobacter sp. 5414T-23]